MREIKFKNSQDASMYNKGYEQGREDAIDGKCNMKEIYEIVGIRKDGNVRIYQSGTIKQIEENELLNQVEHKNINDILRDMDCFSDYKHYARLVL